MKMVRKAIDGSSRKVSSRKEHAASMEVKQGFAETERDGDVSEDAAAVKIDKIEMEPERRLA